MKNEIPWFSLRFLRVLCVSALKGLSRGCPLRPAFDGAAGFYFGHRDAVFYWADQPAEVAADAFGFVDAGDAGGRGGASGGT